MVGRQTCGKRGVWEWSGLGGVVRLEWGLDGIQMGGEQMSRQ